MFEDERPKPVPCGRRFDGFHALPASVSKTCFVRFDNTRHSVNAYADRIVVRQAGGWSRSTRARSAAAR